MLSLEHLQKNLAMIRNLKMTDQEVEDLKLAALGSETGLYYQQCRKCIPQCPYNLDIPAIMRSYMYAYGYRNTQQAFHTLADTGISEKTCEECSTCNVKCVSGFDIKRKITDISRLRLVPEEFLKA